MLYFPSRRKNFGFWWAIAGVVLVIIALNIAPVRGLIQKIVAPLGSGLISWNSDFKNWLASFRPSTGALDENENLKKQNEKLLAEISQLKIASEENKNLKQLAGFIEQSPYDLVSTRVVGKVQELPGADKIFLIDRGRADGLEVGMPVITLSGDNIQKSTSGFLLGKILKIDEKWSQVLLITDYNSKVAASVISSDGVLDCVISGKHGLSLTADFLPINKKIISGDLIVTSGLENFIPQGLLIGAVNEVQTQPGDLFHKVDIKPLGNLNGTRLLMVIKSYD